VLAGASAAELGSTVAAFRAALDGAGDDEPVRPA
jgi:hypothetical protein